MIGCDLIVAAEGTRFADVVGTRLDATVGYRATVVAIRANEAVLNGGRVNITKEDLTI